MSCSDGLECRLEIGVWLNAVELAGLDQGSNARPGPTPFVMYCEERVFPVEGNRADCALDGFVAKIFRLPVD